MTPIDALALFLIMTGLAAIPSSSVALVVVRSATRGVRNGVATALGIVTGDLIFVAMAVFGLTALADAMGALFVVVRYIAAGYLIWFGIGLIRKPAGSGAGPVTPAHGGLATSFAAGVSLTLGDVKAILFYASLFPAFVDVPALGAGDIAVIAAVTVLAVGGVKIAYAVTAGRIAAAATGFAFDRPVRIATGGLMIGAGGYLILKP